MQYWEGDAYLLARDQQAERKRVDAAQDFDAMHLERLERLDRPENKETMTKGKVEKRLFCVPDPAKTI